MQSGNLFSSYIPVARRVRNWYLKGLEDIPSWAARTRGRDEVLSAFSVPVMGAVCGSRALSLGAFRWCSTWFKIHVVEGPWYSHKAVFWFAEAQPEAPQSCCVSAVSIPLLRLPHQWSLHRTALKRFYSSFKRFTCLGKRAKRSTSLACSAST